MKNLLSFVLIIALTNFSLTAQSLLEGSISNNDGTTLTSATVVLHHVNNENLSKTLIVDESGYFILEDIPAGTYKLEISNSDYESIIVDNFQFPRDTDQVLGLSFEQPILTNPTVNTDTRNTPEGHVSLAKNY